MKPRSLSDLKNKAVTQAIETIRNRIDALGVSEPTIQEHGLGQYQILVQLPGVDDPERVKDIMQSTAMLEIKQSTRRPISQRASGPAGQRRRSARRCDPASGQCQPGATEGQAWYLVSRVSAVSGKDLRDAQPSSDQNGQPSVSFTLTGEGGQRFYNFTSAHVGDSLAVVLDNKVQEVANIKEPIRDQGSISGGRMSEQQAKDLSMILRSGALPASIKYLEERNCGTVAGRGFDPLRRSCRRHRHGGGIDLHAGLLSRGGRQCRCGADHEPDHPAGVPGLVHDCRRERGADFAGHRRSDSDGRYGRGFQRADFRAHSRRVAEWQNAAFGGGSGLQPCLDHDRGYARYDHRFGRDSIHLRTGPVKGFATTLTFGLLANLFTAVFVSRVIFDWVLSRKQRGEALSI